MRHFAIKGNNFCKKIFSIENEKRIEKYNRLPVAFNSGSWDNSYIDSKSETRDGRGERLSGFS
jgi:hypothetical protein